MSCVLVVCLLVCFFFEVEFHVQNGCVAKSGLELLILLPLFPESWGIPVALSSGNLPLHEVLLGGWGVAGDCGLAWYLQGPGLGLQDSKAKRANK